MMRVKQVSSAHCGPAALKMLLSFYGVKVKQREIVTAAEADDKIMTHGVTVAELGMAVKRLAPAMQLWYKDHATIGELAKVIHEYRHPVGVEWQGEFGEYADEDNGHYAVATQVDTVNNVILLADPFRVFAGTDRQFGVVDFERRWWDTNEIIDKASNRRWYVKDDQMMFVVVPNEVTFPEELGMQRG